MATVPGSPSTPRAATGVNAISTTLAAASAATPTVTATSKDTPEAAVVTWSTTTATPTQETAQTTQPSTPPAADTSPPSSPTVSAVPTIPAVKTDIVTSSLTSSSTSSPTSSSTNLPASSLASSPVSQVSSSQPATTPRSSQVPSSPTLSNSPAGVTSSLSAAAISTTSNGLSSGAVAGIAVGCVVAGIIIGMLAAFLLLKRRSKSESNPQLVDTRVEGKSFDSRAFTASPVEPLLAVSDLDEFLLAPQPDKELAGELRSLGHLIQQHVEDNYHLFPVTQSAGSLNQALTELGLAVNGKTLPGPAQLACMTANPKTRHVALQHVISRVIFDSLTARSTSKLSMLPLAVSSLVREMPPCEKHLGNPEGQYSLSHCVKRLPTNCFLAISHALTRWRQISAFLLNPSRSERGPIVPDESSLAPQARDLVAAMNRFLGAFVDEQARYHQECHLQDVALECARFGYMILSQPAELEWRFETGNAEEFVLCPGLEKVSDSRGVGCTPEVICPPEVHRV